MQQLGPDHPGYIDAVVALAEQHRELGQSADAERCVASAGMLSTVLHIHLGVHSGSSGSGSMAGAAVSLTAWRFHSVHVHTIHDACPPHRLTCSVLDELEELVRSQDMPADHAAAYAFVLRRANILYACGKSVSAGLLEGPLGCRIGSLRWCC